ncbi:MAG: cupin [Alphaproteobacteria bacterium]|nr:MAG: cupin [Alphaproteobacteria bacterium]
MLVPDLLTFDRLAQMFLGEAAPKPTALTEGQREASRTLWASKDGLMEIGVWECTPGRFTADREAAAEFCHFLEGRIEMCHADGTKKILGPGDALMLPRGWKGEWNILEPTRKIYVIHRDGDQGGA